MRRKVAKKGNKIKKENAKLKSNAIFVNLIENLMNKADRKQYLKWPFGLSFKRENSFRKEAIAIEKDKRRTNFNKTIYIGASILD